MHEFSVLTLLENFQNWLHRNVMEEALFSFTPSLQSDHT